MVADRTQRVAELVRRELAQALRTQMDDPRIGMVSITEVRVTRDLGLATVFVTRVGSHEEAEQSVAALNHAAGYLRRLLSRRLEMRTAPALRFRHDTSVERGVALTRLIDRAVAGDQTD